MSKPCPACGGERIIDLQWCETCNGTGEAVTACAPTAEHAAAFRQATRALGITFRHLAKTLGVAAGTVSKWANGHLAVPRYATAYLRAKAESTFIDLPDDL